MKLHQRIREIILVRLKIYQKQKELIRKTFFSLILPQHLKISSVFLYNTVDQIWFIAQDKSTDFNFYTTGHMWIFLASLVPVIWVNLSVTVQRMNDLDISGYWYCLNFVPLLREGFFLYLVLRKGTTGPNKNGPDPLAA